MKKITKVVIPAAGFGTRFLPQTKAMPKEMLPVVDKPVIQYVVEEAVASGIEDIIIVTGWHKRTIEDHFDYPFELEMRLRESGKNKELEAIRRVSNMANFIYVRQKGPMGNATPIYNARHIIGDEPFLVLWGDDFIRSTPPRAKQLIDAYNKYQTSIVGAIRTKKIEDTKRYGYAAGKMIEKGVLRVTDLVEKPGPEKVPSDFAIVSGYVFTPEIFDCIGEMMEKNETDVGGEYVYIDALRKLMSKYKQNVHAVEIKNGKYYDTGNKLEYMKTVVELALEHPDINGEFRTFLKTLKL